MSRPGIPPRTAASAVPKAAPKQTGPRSTPTRQERRPASHHARRNRCAKPNRGPFPRPMKIAHRIAVQGGGKRSRARKHTVGELASGFPRGGRAAAQTINRERRWPPRCQSGRVRPESGGTRLFPRRGAHCGDCFAGGAHGRGSPRIRDGEFRQDSPRQAFRAAAKRSTNGDRRAPRSARLPSTPMARPGKEDGPTNNGAGQWVPGGGGERGWRETSVTSGGARGGLGRGGYWGSQKRRAPANSLRARRRGGPAQPVGAGRWASIGARLAQP